MPHYLNIDDYDARQWIIEDDDEKINKRLIPYDYTFYKIHKNGYENYIGSTVDYHKRKTEHKSDCNNKKSPKYNFPVYKYIRDNGGYNTFNHTILDTKFCNKIDAEIYEGELMKIHKSTLNKQRNFTDADKKEYKKDYNKEYQKNEKKNECDVCNCFIKRNRAMKNHILTKKHIKNLENRIKQLEEEQNINNITINIQNLTINQPTTKLT